ncbi:MAG: VOC family protein, partial [Bacteroidota bacterium]
MKNIFWSFVLLSACLTLACGTPDRPEPITAKPDLAKPQNQKAMNHYVSIFEIPATDMERARNFYQSILGLEIEVMEFEGMQMGLLPFENQAVVGIITKGEGYTPSPDGVTIYLNGGDDLQPILDKVGANGGTILVPKTPHADESGFFAIFLDPEG